MLDAGQVATVLGKSKPSAIKFIQDNGGEKLNGAWQIYERAVAEELDRQQQEIILAWQRLAKESGIGTVSKTKAELLGTYMR